jgi:hypothetical protein
MFTLSQPVSGIISPAPSQQNFLEVLNSLHEQCQETPNYSTINPADISSNVPLSTAQSLTVTQTQFTARRDNVDVQEAVSLLAMLRNSGMSYQ